MFIFQRLVCISMRPGFAGKSPCLVVYEFDPSWNLCQKRIHHIEGLNYAHDFVLLPDYYVFHMTPFVKGSWWITTKILLGWSSPGDCMRYYPELPSRFVIIPRNTSGDNAGIMFVDTDPCHVSSKCQFSTMGNQQFQFQSRETGVPCKVLYREAPSQGSTPYSYIHGKFS